MDIMIAFVLLQPSINLMISDDHDKRTEQIHSCFPDIWEWHGNVPVAPPSPIITIIIMNYNSNNNE